MTDPAAHSTVVFSDVSACARVTQTIIPLFFLGAEIYATRAQAETSDFAINRYGGTLDEIH